MNESKNGMKIVPATLYLTLSHAMNLKPTKYNARSNFRQLNPKTCSHAGSWLQSAFQSIVKELLTCRVALSAILFFCSSFQLASAQGFRPDLSAETRAMFPSGDQVPYCFLSNRQGLIKSEGPAFVASIRMDGKLWSHQKWTLAYFSELNGVRQGNDWRMNTNRAGVAIHYGVIRLIAGLLAEQMGNQDSSLSSGGLLWSNNAPSIPMVSVGVSRYHSVPFTKNWLSFKGGMAHGWIGNDPYVPGALLHKKYLFLKLGNDRPVSVHAGIIHAVVWGGTSKDTAVGKMPDGFDDFFRVFLGKQGDESSDINEQINALGNHLGSYQFGADFTWKNGKLSLYWQTLFEDGSGKRMRNIADGLWGISFRMKEGEKLITGAVYEYLHTSHQSGAYDSYWVKDGLRYLHPVEGGTLHFAGGGDNYFNNWLYRSGWTRKGMSMGSPLLTSGGMLANENSTQAVVNNLVEMYHVGLEGHLSFLAYRLLLTHSHNSGTKTEKFRPPHRQFSGMIEMTTGRGLPGGLTARIALAVDRGNLFGNNWGIEVGILYKR